MAKREKKVVLNEITQDEMETAMADYAAADAEIAKINAAMDLKFTEIRERYAQRLSALQERKEKAFDVVQAFAEENKNSLFAKKKSMETSQGVIGFRIGTPKLKTLRGFTWGAVLNMLKEFLPGYVRISEEPAKDKLLADRENPEVAPLFPRVGIYVDQDETFFIELKKEDESILKN